MITFIQILFINDDNTLTRWHESFSSLRNSLCRLHMFQKQNVIFGGYISPYYRDGVLNTIDTIRELITVHCVWGLINIGKSLSINHIAKTCYKLIKQIVVCYDSDIKEFDCIGDIIHLFISQDIFKVLVPNQIQDSRHNLRTLDKKIQIGSHTILYQSKYDTQGIAGGFLVTQKDVLLMFPFRNVGTYGPEDTYFFRDLFVNKFSVGLVADLFVTHPFDKDVDSNKRKRDILQHFFLTTV